MLQAIDESTNHHKNTKWHISILMKIGEKAKNEESES
jgi:hypothetical protein